MHNKKIQNLLVGIGIVLFGILFFEIILFVTDFTYDTTPYHVVDLYPYFISHEDNVYRYIGYFLATDSLIEDDAAFFSPHIKGLPKKKHNEYRIHIFGGSVVAWSDSMGYMQKKLSTLYPNKTITIINFGMPSVGSQKILHYYRDTFRYKPDLVIIHVGNNEFFDKDVPRAVLTPLNKFLLTYSRTYQFCSYIYFVTMRSYIVNTYDEAKKKKLFSSNSFIDGYYDDIMKKYAQNIETMYQIAKEYDVDVLGSTLAYNRAGILFSSQQDSKKGYELMKSGQSQSALNYLEYNVSKLRENNLYDFDSIPSATPHTNAIIKNLSSHYHIPLVDIDKLVLEQYDSYSTGWDIFIDHVHYASDPFQSYETYSHSAFLYEMDDYNMNIYSLYNQTAQHSPEEFENWTSLHTLWADRFIEEITNQKYIK